MVIDEDEPNEFAGKLWEALNEDNKVSLFVRVINLKTQEYEDVIKRRFFDRINYTNHGDKIRWED